MFLKCGVFQKHNSPFIPRGYFHHGLKGGPVGLVVLLDGYQTALFVKHILPNGGILRLLDIKKISTQYAPPYGIVSVQQ